MRDQYQSLYDKLIQSSRVTQDYASIRRLYLKRPLIKFYLRNHSEEFKKGFLDEIQLINKETVNDNIYRFYANPDNFIGKKKYNHINQELEVLYKLLGYLTCSSTDALRIEKENLDEEIILERCKISINPSIEFFKNQDKNRLPLRHLKDLEMLERIDINDSFHRNVLIYWESMRNTFKDLIIAESNSKTKNLNFLEKCFNLSMN